VRGEALGKLPVAALIHGDPFTTFENGDRGPKADGAKSERS